MPNINTTAFSDAIKTLYDKRLLAVAVPRFVHGRWAEVGTFTGYSAVEFRKYGLLDAVTTALSNEGVTPDEGRASTLTTSTLTPSLYGSWLGYTKEIQIKAFDPVLSEMINRLGEQAALSVDTLVRNTMVGSATADYAGGATSTATIDTTNDKITFADVIYNVTVLEAQNARPADGQYFPVIIHPYTYATLMQDTMFVTIFTREGGQAYRSGRIGNLLQLSFYMTSNAYPYTSEGYGSCTPYSMLFIGWQSVGVAGFSGLIANYNTGFGAGEYSVETGNFRKPIEIIVRGLGETGFDPLKQRGTVGWLLSHTATVLNSSWIRDCEHATIGS